MDFKEVLADDVNNVFLNQSEFADLHTLNGKEVTAIIDDDILDGEINMRFHGQAQERMSGLYSGGIAIYISKNDFGKPAPTSSLEVDGKNYRVISTSEQDGMYKINAQRVGAR